MDSDYQEFLGSKKHIVGDAGKLVNRGVVHSKLFEWQRDIVIWAAKKGEID